MILQDIDVANIIVPKGYLFVKHKRNTCEAIRITRIMLPIVVKRTEQGYILLDGLERIYCAKELGMKQVPALVVEDNRSDIITLALNWVRGRVCGIDVLMYTWQLLQTYDASLVKSVLGKSWDTLTKYKNTAEHIIALQLSSDDFSTLRELCTPVRKLIFCAFNSHERDEFMSCVLSKTRVRLKKVTYDAVMKAVALEKDEELRNAVEIVQALGKETVGNIIELVSLMRKTLCARLDYYKKYMVMEDYKLLKRLCQES